VGLSKLGNLVPSVACRSLTVDEEEEEKEKKKRRRRIAKCSSFIIK
jgi:hypothetical protein